MTTVHSEFAREVIAGLSRPPGRKSVEPKHLYDATGSVLFDRIVEQPEYYLPDVERKIVDASADSIRRAVGSGTTVVEPGCGDGSKAVHLLGVLDEPDAFAPVEISETALELACDRVSSAFPDLDVHPVCAPFQEGLDRVVEETAHPRIVYFPGSTIGNLEPGERAALLSRFNEVAGDDGAALVTFDMVKDSSALEAAYDDSAGVSAAFALNVLDRLNRELDADLDVDAFRYQAEWDESGSRVRMAIVSECDQEFEIAGEPIALAAGESIRTEHSYKFTPEQIASEAHAAGAEIAASWTDDRSWVSVCLLRPSGS